MSGEATAPFPRNQALLALGIRLFAVLMLSLMTLCIRTLALHKVSLAESMFYRNMFAFPLIFAYIAVKSGIGSLRTKVFGKHMTRTLVGLTGMAFTFEAYRVLHLADATAISFTTPIFATILAATVLGERVGLHRWSAVLIGFLGVLIVTHPGSSVIPARGAAIALISAALVAIISILLRQLGRTEAATTTAFWFCFLGALIMVVPMLWAAQPHTGGDWTLLFALGFTGAVAQVALNASLQLAPITTVITMDYTGLVWATLFGFLLFGHLPAATTWMGAPLIIGSGLYIAFREHRRGVVREKSAI